MLEVYQHIFQVLQGCDGTQVIADDIIVHGCNEHKVRLERILVTLCSRNLTINPDKSMFEIKESLWDTFCLTMEFQ